MDTSSSKPVVGLGGFFGYGNYGDELFVDVFKQYLSDQFELKILPDQLDSPYFTRPIEQHVAEVDAVLIGGGDLIQGWSFDPRYFSKHYLTKPVFIAGVGTPIRHAATAGNQVEKPGIVARYKNFLENPSLKFFNVRDDQAANWINKRIEPAAPVQVSPDIVCALDLPAVTLDPAQPPILGLVSRYRPNREVPDDFSQMQALARHVMAKGWRVRHIILGTGRVGERDIESAERLEIPGKELIYSQNLDDLSRAIGECAVLASMKFHGTVVATMYGVPSMVLVPTNKNRNFMKRIGRDDLIAKFDDPALVEKFDAIRGPIDPAARWQLRQDAAAMLERLKATIAAELGVPA
ncbi:MAG: polysaccharide pyruvyl transferase family protein [Neomegalonema sp.]|nr:polysaccharide pyruvyl transferase family protein [Neomegalonema sp.]